MKSVPLLLLTVFLAACAPTATAPSPIVIATTQLPTSISLSTPAPANTSAPPTMAASLTPPPTSVPATVAPLPSATLNPWRFFPTCCESATPIAVSALPAAKSHTGWKHYSVPDYDFGLDLPPDWQLAVEPHALYLVPDAAPQMALTISFRGPIEDVNIVRSGVAAGDIITRGTVTILGQTVLRNLLIYQGKDKAVLYNSAAEIDTPQIVVTVSLDGNGPDYDAVALPPTVQATADQIVATLVTVAPSPDWKTYISPMFHVRVQYPPTWHPDATGQALYGGPDGFFNITAAASLAPTAQIACQITLGDAQTHNGLEPQFGHQPTMQVVQVDHQPACLILPSADQQAAYRGLALLFVDYPTAIARGDILQFWADKNHIRDLAARLTFVHTP